MGDLSPDPELEAMARAWRHDEYECADLMRAALDAYRSQFVCTTCERRFSNWATLFEHAHVYLHALPGLDGTYPYSATEGGVSRESRTTSSVAPSRDGGRAPDPAVDSQNDPQPTRVRPLDVACPTCGAKRGALCTLGNGSDVELYAAHDARHEAIVGLPVGVPDDPPTECHECGERRTHDVRCSIRGAVGRLGVPETTEPDRVVASFDTATGTWDHHADGSVTHEPRLPDEPDRPTDDEIAADLQRLVSEGYGEGWRNGWTQGQQRARLGRTQVGVYNAEHGILVHANAHLVTACPHWDWQPVWVEAVPGTSEGETQ